MDGDTKPCPVCGETIKAVALKCRFCNTDLSTYLATKDAETEKDLYAGRPAMIYSVGQFLPIGLVLVLTVAIIVFAGDKVPVGYLLLAALLVEGVICLRYYFKSASIRYEITNQRIRLERGLLSKVQESLELFRIDHFELRKPIGMRLLGQSSLHIYTTDTELAAFYIYGVPNLESLANELRTCQLRERTRRGLTTFVKA